MEEMSVDQAIKTVLRMLKESEYSFFVSHGPSGMIHTRLMQPFTPEPNLTLWFGAGPQSRKVKEVQSNADATVAVMHPHHGGYASLMGKAEIVNDPEKKQIYWRSHWTDIYPGGPDNDEYTLIKFVPSRIELMEFEQEAQPSPYALKPIGLEQKGGSWKIITDRASL